MANRDIGRTDHAADRCDQGLPAEFRAASERGELPRAVIFFPQGDNGFWANWYDGTRLYQDWILEELIPEVSRRDHTLPCPEDCHVMGVSMGGYGSLTRLFGGAFGSAMSFAVGAAPSAPGQVPIEDLNTVLDILQKSMAPKK